MNKIGLIVIVFLLSHCATRQPITSVPKTLPVPVSNNAVAYLSVNDKDQYYSFNGLKSGKTYQDITANAFIWKQGMWRSMNVPDQQLPVLASTAVSVKQAVYLIGGYTVAADHTEKSIPNVWRIDGETDRWDAMPDIPIPVDDTVALVYQDRYIYLISGWHNVDNVDLVQVFDTEKQLWHQATPFPLPAVFGHAGGIVNNQMVICDGVKVIKFNNKKQFVPSAECALGEIDPNDIMSISWNSIRHHSGTAYYRMAAAGLETSEVYFVAGSDNPYNYNGIGYNEIPAQPSNDVRIYDVSLNKWTISKSKMPKSMDHRALLNTPYGLIILGGMLKQQQVSDQVINYKK